MPQTRALIYPQDLGCSRGGPIVAVKSCDSTVGPIIQSELGVPAFASPFRLLIKALILIIVFTGGGGGGSDSGSDKVSNHDGMMIKKQIKQIGRM